MSLIQDNYADSPSTVGLYILIRFYLVVVLPLEQAIIGLISPHFEQDALK